MVGPNPTQGKIPARGIRLKRAYLPATAQLLMTIGWLVVIGAVAAGLFWLVNRRRRAADVALEVLRDRYARGAA